MRIRAAVSIAIFSMSSATFLGCASSSSTAPTEKKTDVHIKTPGADIDVHHKGNDKDNKTNVDVKTKER